ncbi:hypothetical protein FOXYS1_11385 [Fusarium oxysporum]|uniref:NmrA-like domain-containing protein n=1 Tax=Fusarium oxysporum TaxID=5507 RepID=A0A8H5EEJ8_FUSOX|nr:hypothetical protein FOXYS1_11385 [Fusarium oxysporum]
MNITIVGASGETGRSIINGLLEAATPFNITALVRPASAEKPEIKKLKDEGVNILLIELDSPHKELVNALVGQDVVICSIDPLRVSEQKALADAAKEVKVKRFIPSAFGPVCPPSGVMALREMKEEVINHIKKIYLPYTIIDVGWWYQSSIPKLPSGKIDYAVTFGVSKLVENGNHASSITDLRDVGKYVARIIADDRTINKSVFVYNETRTQEEIFRLLETISGESLPRASMSEEEILAGIAATRKPYDQGSRSFSSIIPLVLAQYPYSVWLRGDNLPERAEYLGYLTSKQLYPGFKYKSFEGYIQELLEGHGEPVYAQRGFTFKK